MDVWTTFQRWFAEDDGSLPGIGVGGLPGDQVAQHYQFLRSIEGSAHRPTQPATFWNRRTKSSESIESVPNAAAVVVSGEAEPFHFLLPSPRFAGATIPDLGVFVFDDSIMLDYRMGAGWNAESVRAFLMILRQMLASGSNARIEFDSAFGLGLEFLDGWDRFLKSVQIPQGKAFAEGA